MKRISTLTFAILLAYSAIPGRASEERLSIAFAPRNELSISWQAASNIYYRLLWTDNLGDSNSWRTFWTTYATGGTISRNFNATNSHRFYKVERTTNLLAGYKLFVDPYSAAMSTWETNSHTTNGPLLSMIATNGFCRWLLGNETNVTEIITNATYLAKEQGPKTMVEFQIMSRPITTSTNSKEFFDYLIRVKQALGDSPAILVLGANSLPELRDLTPTEQSNRLAGLRIGAAILRTAPNAYVALDAGHAHWKSAEEMAAVLKEAHVEEVHGFAINTANFVGDAASIAYGNDISRRINNMHYVVDTSRNGLGPASDGEWCNPSGRALGQKPTLDTGLPLADAFLWIKPPGESDGTCNGGPAAGTFWLDYALGLAERANW